MYSPESQLLMPEKYYTPAQVKDYCLDALAISLARHRSPDYPTQENRLFLEAIPYNKSGVALPNEGPWVSGQAIPNRSQQINEELAMIGHPKGYTLDADYRALHPWWREMVGRTDIGGVIGRGFYYHWGANYTADAAVICTDDSGQENLLLIKRKDTGDWALPGGFIDGIEDGKMAALRELQEESGLSLDQDSSQESHIFEGPTLDIRTTLHAWSETSLWKFTINQQTLPDVAGGDDAAEARWFKVTNLPENLYGSHVVLVAMALGTV